MVSFVSSAACLNWKFQIPALSAAALALLAVGTAERGSPYGAETNAATPFLALKDVNVPEYPAVAAKLVQAAAPADRAQIAHDALQAISMLARPGVMPYVVNAVCRANPGTAGAVVATATQLYPQNVLFFTRAATCAAPEQAGEIVYAACKGAPADFVDITLIAGQLAPSSDDEILKGLAGALPGLKDVLAKAQEQTATNAPGIVLARMLELVKLAQTSDH